MSSHIEKDFFVNSRMDIPRRGCDPGDVFPYRKRLFCEFKNGHTPQGYGVFSFTKKLKCFFTYTPFDSYSGHYYYYDNVLLS
jgi:hypothetical protein